MTPVVVAVSFALLLATGCSRRELQRDWRIVPEQRAGALRAGSTERELLRTYGDSVVRRVRIELGEGETAPGTVLFPRDSLARLEVLWQDTLGFARPARLILRGRASKWRLPSNISLGMTLQELERVNGGEFTLAGFAWDYGGVVLDWQGGSLDHAVPGVTLYLDPEPAQYYTPLYNQVLGDRNYRSSLPAMQQLNPRIYQIYVDFK